MMIAAWVILRVIYAGFFLYPLKDLLKDWPATKNMVAILVPIPALVSLCALAMVGVMTIGALMILLGVYARWAGFMLLFYCLFGVVVHYRLAAQARQLKLTPTALPADQHCLQQAVNLAVLGHLTSGQKNIILAAVACFFMLLGSGPWSLI